MTKSLPLLFSIAALALAGLAYENSPTAEHGATPPTIAEHILKTGTIRCGYFVWPPLLAKDLNTGAVSGVAYDIMEEIGKRLSLKIDWTEETGMDTALEGVSHRYDMFCAPIFAASARSRIVSFSIPYAYTQIYLVTRANDTRFDQDINIINNPDYKISVLEGEATAIYARQKFPLATPHAISQTQGFSFVLKDVELGKADATITDPKTIADYNKTNGGTLKIVGSPVTSNATVFALPNDFRFKMMFDAALNELILDGSIEKILKKHDYAESGVLPISPYRTKGLSP